MLPFGDVSISDKKYLSSSEGIIKITARIRALSNELAGDAKTPWDAVQSFWRFLFARLEFGRIHPHSLNADDPLGSIVETGRSDCYFGSALLVALCRARGIPARLVSGYFLYSGSQTNHWWSEILIPPYGWVPCDLWSWSLADGDINNEWAEKFLGCLDPRLIIERFPRQQLILEQPNLQSTYTFIKKSE